MISDIKLTKQDLVEIKKLASETRRLFGVHGNVPIANNLFMLIEDKDIIICQYPFEETTNDERLDATLTWFETEDEPIYFIGLNSQLHLDQQLFALAHELYHFITETGEAYSNDKHDAKVERKADRFAAELLLPSDVLSDLILEQFGDKDLNNLSDLRLHLFIARLQCDWYLSYLTVIMRLFEEGHINQKTFDHLMTFNDRDRDNPYSKIIRSIDERKYNLLKSSTLKKGFSPKFYELVINNYEDELISKEELKDLLGIFEKAPEDFGIRE